VSREEDNPTQIIICELSIRGYIQSMSKLPLSHRPYHMPRFPDVKSNDGSWTATSSGAYQDNARFDPPNAIDNDYGSLKTDLRNYAGGDSFASKAEASVWLEVAFGTTIYTVESILLHQRKFTPATAKGYVDARMKYLTVE